MQILIADDYVIYYIDIKLLAASFYRNGTYRTPAHVLLSLRHGRYLYKEEKRSL